MTDSSSLLNNASLMSKFKSIVSQWGQHFVERIYQICGHVHPGMAIDQDAVIHIKDTISQILMEILDPKPANVSELEKVVLRVFPKSLHWVTKDALEATKKFHTARFGFSKPHESVRIFSLIEFVLGTRENERRDRERENETERMAVYVESVCEVLTEDILKWTGNYVKHIRSTDHKISLQNLKIALNADKGLMQLTSFLNNEEEDVFAGGFLSNFYEYDEDTVDAYNISTNVTYESIAHEFLKEERLYLRELNQANVLRRRLEIYLREDEKGIIKQLFGNLSEIYELTMKVERTLEDSIEMNDGLCIGMGFWELSEAYEFDGYLSYLVRGDDDEMLYNVAIESCLNEILSNPQYSHIFSNDDGGYTNSLEGITLRLTLRCVLPNLLNAPVIHIFRYLEYINKLLRCCQTEEDRADLDNCKIYLSNVANKMENQYSHLKMRIKQEQTARNDSRISQVKKLQSIQNSIDGFYGNPIGKTCNELIKEGNLQMVRPSVAITSDVTKKGRWATERYIFLFDQLIVICKKHKSTTKFKDRASVQSVDIVDLDDRNGLRHSFRLDIREKTGIVRSYSMVCKTASEKSAWLTALVTVSTKGLLDRISDSYQKEESKRIPLIIPSPDQYRYAEADSEENISFEDYTSSSGIPEIKSGTILKLVERLTYHQYADNKFAQTFLISYRSFCAPSELLELLIERFNVPIPSRLHTHETRGGPLAGRYDTVQSHGLSSATIDYRNQEQCYQRFRKEYERPIQRRVLAVMQQWVKNHWYDFENDALLLDNLKKFLQKSCETSGKLTNQHKKFCKNIIALIEKLVVKSAGPCDGHMNTAFDWDEAAAQGQQSNEFQPKKPDIVWHAAKKGEIENYDLLTLHPLEIGRQLTILHFDLYRAIKPIELVDAAWTKHDKYQRSPQLLKLTGHCTLLTYWISRSIVETESLDERVAMFSRVIEVMSVFEKLHNFTGMVAFLSALNSACVHRLTHCWGKLDTEKVRCYDRFTNLCDTRYIKMQNKLKSINPPCVPFFGHYLSNIFRYEAGNSTFVKNIPQAEKEKDKVNNENNELSSPVTGNNKRVLISFFKCRRISDQIREIQMYQNQPYSLQVEPSIRQFFESINPKSDFNDDEDRLQTYLYDRSLKIQPKDSDKPLDINKSKRPLHVLKSPGIKPPKSNVYTPNNPPAHTHQQAMTVPSTPNPDIDSLRSAFLPTTRDDSQMTIDSQQMRHYSGEGIPSVRRMPQPAPKIGLLQPPPVFPRNRSSPKTLPPLIQSSAIAPPPLHPKMQPKSPLSAKTPPTPKSANRAAAGSDTFVFPATETSAPLPIRTHRHSGDCGAVSEQRVIYERPRSTEAHSPTVCLSVLLPPALPPRRGAHVQLAPPPLPPKPNRRTSTSPSTVSTSPVTTPTFLATSPTNTSPPPLPPKTYKHKQNSPGLPRLEK